MAQFTRLALVWDNKKVGAIAPTFLFKNYRFHKGFAQFLIH